MDILPPDDGKEIFKPVQAELRDGDIAFGNLEGSLCDEGKPIKCKVPLSGNCFELANSLQLAEGKAKRFFVTEVHCSNPPTIRKEINSTGEDNRYTALLCFATCKSTGTGGYRAHGSVTHSEVVNSAIETFLMEISGTQGEDVL